MPELEQTLSYSLILSWWQQLGLAFLLGSFAVATLSDLKYLSAQREFVEVWLLFLVVVLGFEIYDLRRGLVEPFPFYVKWGLIALLSLLSLNRVGVLFRLAVGDVAALAAVASLLPPSLILLLYGLAKVFGWAGQKLFPRRQYLPFMPMVSLATLAVLALGLLG